MKINKSEILKELKELKDLEDLKESSLVKLGAGAAIITGGYKAMKHNAASGNSLLKPASDAITEADESSEKFKFGKERLDKNKSDFARILKLQNERKKKKELSNADKSK